MAKRKLLACFTNIGQLEDITVHQLLTDSKVIRFPYIEFLKTFECSRHAITHTAGLLTNNKIPTNNLEKVIFKRYFGSLETGEIDTQSTVVEILGKSLEYAFLLKDSMIISDDV